MVGLGAFSNNVGGPFKPPLSEVRTIPGRMSRSRVPELFGGQP